MFETEKIQFLRNNCWLWNNEFIVCVLCEDEELGGAGLSLFESNIRKSQFKGAHITQILKELKDKNPNIVAEDMKKQFNDLPCEEIIAWIITDAPVLPLWVKIKFGSAIVENFMKSSAKFDKLEEESRKLFNGHLEKFGLHLPNTKVMFEGINGDFSCSDKTNSNFLRLEFADTFPEWKYENYEEQLLKKFEQIYGVFCCSDPSGMGKTHFAYHLAMNKRMVLPVNSIMYSKLSELISNHISQELHEVTDTQAIRKEMDTIARTFLFSIMLVANHLFVELIKKKNWDVAKFSLHLFRFLRNEGFQNVSKVFSELLILRDLSLESVPLSMPSCIFLFDECHTLCNFLKEKVPHNSLNEDAPSGNLLTLLVSNAKTFGHCLLTTTEISKVSNEISNSIICPVRKTVINRILFSTELSFDQQLPPLWSKDFLHFVRFFINVEDIPNVLEKVSREQPLSEKQKEHLMWFYVSRFLQGRFVFCERFINNLYWNARSKKEYTTTELIHVSLAQTLYQLTNPIEGLIDTISNNLRLKEPENHQQIEAALLSFMLTGRCEVSTSYDKLSIELMRNGITFTTQRKGKVTTFSMISLIDKALFMNILRKRFQEEKVNWMQKLWEFVKLKKELYSNSTTSKRHISLISEVMLINLLMTNYDKLVLPGMKDTYLEHYEFQGYHYAEDDTEPKENKFLSLSSLMIIAIDQNNCPNPLFPRIDLDYMKEDARRSFQLISTLVRPNNQAGIDIIGCLTRKENAPLDLPFSIPLTVSITTIFISEKGMENCDTKFRKDYLVTDLRSMYTQKKEDENKNTTFCVNKENITSRKEVESSISSIISRGKMLRILFHPNETVYENNELTLATKVNEWEQNVSYANLDGSVNDTNSSSKYIKDNRFTCINGDGHVVYHICKDNPHWLKIVNENPYISQILEETK
ncbi:hypothetical protein ABK040_014453 [Willaertia magna]